MKHTQFTPDIGQAIVASSLKYCDGQNRYCTPVTYWRDDKPLSKGEGCHRYCIDEMIECPYGYTGKYHTHYGDILGLIYRGWGKKGPCTEDLGPEARDYLLALMHPESAFKELFPYIWKTDVDEIIADKVIVFKNLLDARLNPGLFWTFAQASRFMFEQNSKMAAFQYLKERYDLNTALWGVLSLSPAGKFTDPWAAGVAGHCAPLGSNAGVFRSSMIRGETQFHSEHQTRGSYQCFPDRKLGIESDSYGCVSIKLSVDDWVGLTHMTGADVVKSVAA